ncbi:AEC family transporter [Salicibibacter kimchii]|uniref:Auxin efflux carrier n=1 Tax=Salicibibacter kimchii TaxID=2099786 RepID=A0A345BXR9_9BACI|nr:AEC family transporter [Salicibibacter kimchii]AXF55750.1 auxin efflux carrier [Salicibibacter kimchii]
MDVATVTLAIATMALIIVLGAAVAFRFPITDNTKQLFMGIIINIAVPAIILNGIFNTDISEQIMQQAVTIFIFSIIFHAGAVFFAFLVGRMFRFSSSWAKKLAILSAFGNTGFIGIPLSFTIFGPTGGLLASVFNAGLDLMIFSLGIFMLQSHGQFDFRQLKALLNAPLIALVVGGLFAFSGLDAPVILQDLTEMLSSLSAPLSMLYIGFLLPPFFKKGQKFVFPKLWFPLSMRLLIIPIISITIIAYLPMDDFLKQLFIILVPLPTFTLATVLFSRYTEQENESVMTIIYSTILCLATIPIIAVYANFIS